MRRNTVEEEGYVELGNTGPESFHQWKLSTRNKMSGDVGTSDETIGTTSDEDNKLTRIYSDIKPMPCRHHLYYV